MGEHQPDPPLCTLTDVAGSAELATQTALDLLLNMSTQRELAMGSLQVRRAGGGGGRLPSRPAASSPVLLWEGPAETFLRLSHCPATGGCGEAG